MRQNTESPALLRAAAGLWSDLWASFTDLESCDL